MEPGETIEDTPLRELAEEVDGPSVYTLNGPVWTRSFFHTFAGRETDLHEWYFVASVAASDIRDVRETGEGAIYFEGWRWWTLGELVQHDGPLAPAALATRCPRSFGASFPQRRCTSRIDRTSKPKARLGRSES